MAGDAGTGPGTGQFVVSDQHWPDEVDATYFNPAGLAFQGTAKADIAYATPLAKFAIRQYRDGRRLGSKLNVRDVSSEYAQRIKGICLERLDKYDFEEDSWQEIDVGRG